MSWRRIGITVTGATALLSIPLAVSTVWLVLTSPAAVVGALDQRSVAPLARQLAAALADVLRELAAYL